MLWGSRGSRVLLGGLAHHKGGDGATNGVYGLRGSDCSMATRDALSDALEARTLTGKQGPETGRRQSDGRRVKERRNAISMGVSDAAETVAAAI